MTAAERFLSLRPSWLALLFGLVGVPAAATADQHSLPRLSGEIVFEAQNSDSNTLGVLLGWTYEF